MRDSNPRGLLTQPAFQAHRCRIDAVHKRSVREIRLCALSCVRRRTMVNETETETGGDLVSLGVLAAGPSALLHYVARAYDDAQAALGTPGERWWSNEHERIA